MKTHLIQPLFDEATSAGLFLELWAELPWERRLDAPRRECWMNDYGRSYTYGRGAGQRTYEAKPWYPRVRDVREHLSFVLGIHYHGCFCNGYNGERDHLGWHSDDDPGIDHSKPIAVVSLGATREIQTRLIKDPPDLAYQMPKPLSFTLESGSLFLMPAGSQQTHQHRIPKVGHSVGPRISLTFRALL